MKKLYYSLLLLLSLTFGVNSYAVSYGTSLGDGIEVAAQSYATFGVFPTLAQEGALGLDTATGDLYYYHNATWNLVSGGGGGTVTNVTATSPLLSSGGATPDISMPVATAIADGYLSAANFASFAAKEPAISATTSADYYRGDKTFQNFNAASIASVLTGYTAGAGTVAATDSVLSALQKIDANDALKIPLTQKAAANGVATLDAGGKIPAGQLPNSVMEFQGQWNAATNTPALADGVGNNGDVYRANVAGTTNFGSGNITFAVGDWAMYDGTVWQLAHAGADVVVSVNGFAGAVVLTTTDIAEGTNLYFTDARVRAAPITGFVSGAGTVAATDTVLQAINKLDGNSIAGLASKWSLAGNAGTGGTGKIGTTDAQNFDIIAGNSTVATVVQSYKGISAAPTIIPADATGVNQFDWRTYVSPTASTNGASHVTNYSELIWDNPNAGFNNINGNLVASQSVFNQNGSGSINYASTNTNTANFNNGTTSQFKGVTSENGIATGVTVSDYYGIVSGLNSTGAILPSSKGISQYVGLTDAVIGNAAGIDSNMTFSGTTANSQGVTGLNSFSNFNDTASVTNTVYGTSVGIDANDDSVLTGGMYGFNSFFNLRDNADVGFLYGLNIGINHLNASTSTGANIINLNATYSNTSDGQSVNMFNGYVKTEGTANLTSLSGINMNPELEGSSTVGSYTGLGIGGQIRGSSTVPNVTGANINPQMSGSAAVDNFQGLFVNPQINGTSTLTNGITGATFKPEGSVLVTGATGVSIDMGSISLTSGVLAAGGQKKALNINDGAIEAGYNYTVPGAAGFFQTNYIGGSAIVASGDPAAAFGFGNNFAHTVTLHDDWTIDASGLGFVDVGFVGALAFDAGTTMAQWTGALGGAGNPSGAGTLTTAKMFSAAGVLPQGGALTVTNMYGFEVNPNLFCLIGTNCWGFYEDTAAAENHLSKLAIGTSTKKVANSSTALEIGNSKSFLNGSGSTATKNALTALAGMQFYDTTLNELQWYNGSAWVPAYGAGSVTAVSVATANGFAGSSSGGATPALTLSTTITGVLKGNGTAISAAVANTDYLPATSGSAIQKADGSGGLTAAVSNTDYQAPISTSAAVATQFVTGFTAPNTFTRAQPDFTDLAGTATTAQLPVVPVAKGGTNSSAALSNNRVMQSSGGAIVEAAAITASRALISDANGIPVHSAVTSTELGYVSGVTSAIQTQLNGKAASFTDIQEAPAGAIDNSNTAFALSTAPVSNASVSLYLDGLILIQGTDYTLSGTTITMTTPPNFAQFLYAKYRF